MAIKLADVFVPITGDDTPLRRTLGRTRQFLGNWVNQVVAGIGQGIGQSIFNSITGGIQRGMRLVRSSLSAASDLNEALSKTVVAFGSSAGAILEWSKTSATALGQSREQALEAASSFGLLFSSMGLAEDASADMSKRLVELATDMASINNIGIDEALIKLRAGLVGETEPLRTVGVLLNAAAVESEALASGLAESKDAISESDKVMARYNLILRQTAKTQGDFQRTIEGIANQERILQAQRQDALAQIGAAFSPIYLVILRNINRILAQISPYGENIVRNLATGMVKGIIHILPALRAVRDVIVYWLKPGSPPRLLPDLVRWGASAMNEYLGGWASADFSVLERLGGTIESILRSFVTSGAIAENEIVSRVFGSRQAIADAINQWRTAGQVTEDSLQAIQSAAGPAGFSLAGIVRAYFDLEGASRSAAQAQRELTEATEYYDRILRPLNDELDEITEKQQDIRDKQNVSAARRTLRDPRATANEKRLAQLEIEEIKVRDQIRTVEDERDAVVDAAAEKLRAAQKQEQVAQAVFAVQQALLDQQIKTNELIGEENDLRAKAAAESEALYQAMLQYNLAIADTEGKLALLRLELGRYEQGSAEYYGILTQIAGLESQLKSEREAGESLVPGDSIIPDVGDLDIPKWAEELAAVLDKEIRKAFGIGPPTVAALIGPQGEGEFRTMNDFLQEGPTELPIAQGVKDFVDTLKSLTTSVGDLKEPLENLVTIFKVLLPEAVDENEKVVQANVDATEEQVKGRWIPLWDLFYRSYINALESTRDDGGEIQDKSSADFALYLGVIDAGVNGGWKEAWDAYVDIQKIALDRSIENNRQRFQWLMDLFPGSGGADPADASSPLTDLDQSGGNIMDAIWEGMKTKWGEISEWWRLKLAAFRDMLPFSEPKDPSSPLSGLADAGKAIISQIQLGVDEMSLQLPVPDQGLMAAGASSTTNSRAITLNVHEGAFQFGSVNSPLDAAQAIKQALKELLQEAANA